jgi:hypothetical protein
MGVGSDMASTVKHFCVMTQSIARNEEGQTLFHCFECEARSFATACKRGKNLKMEEAQCAKVHSQVRWSHRLP